MGLGCAGNTGRRSYGRGSGKRSRSEPKRSASPCQAGPGTGAARGRRGPGSLEESRLSQASSASLPLIPHLTSRTGPPCAEHPVSLCSWPSEPSSDLTPRCDRLTSQASTGHVALSPRGSSVVLAGQLACGCSDLGSGPDCGDHGEGCSEG